MVFGVSNLGAGRIEGIMSSVLWLGVPGSEKGADRVRGDVVETTT
jgi:hypothetical protein